MAGREEKWDMCGREGEEDMSFRKEGGRDNRAFCDHHIVSVVPASGSKDS